MTLEPGAQHDLQTADRLTAIEQRLEGLEDRIPSWLRSSTDESRWLVIATLAVTIAIQFAVKNYFPVDLWRVIIALELALLAVLLGINVAGVIRGKPGMDRVEKGLVSTLLIAVAFSNVWSALRLDYMIITRERLPDEAIPGVTALRDSSAALLIGGAAIILTNITVFGILYWLRDLGGPDVRGGRRKTKREYHPDFLFPQQANPEAAPSNWEPRFLDYLYVSYTNVVAFSPSDTMPLTRGAKGMMALQSALAVSTLALVIARAVNVLDPPT